MTISMQPQGNDSGKNEGGNGTDRRSTDSGYTKSGSSPGQSSNDSDSANKETAKKLLDIGGLAGILNVPKSWLYQRTRLGQKGIPHYKMGKYVRFDLDVVLAFLSPLNSDDERRA